jgi:acyl dehydratase
MTDTQILTEPPNLGLLYPKAVLTAGGRSGKLPTTRLLLPDVPVDTDRLARYARVCGFSLGKTLPVTYPHIQAFGLAIALMADRSFPFPLPGLVHVRNAITQVRPIDVGESLTFAVHAQGLRPHRRGRQFDLVAQAWSGDGELIWIDTSTYLRRGTTAGAARPDDLPAEAGPAAETTDSAPDPAPTAVWKIDGGVGRRYGAVSGDRNPIHMHPLAARAFGFPRAIAHGMWVKARCLATLEGRLPDAYTVDVRFQKPVLLPTTVGFAAEQTGDGWEFSVRGTKNGTPHLHGTVDGKG